MIVKNDKVIPVPVGNNAEFVKLTSIGGTELILNRNYIMRIRVLEDTYEVIYLALSNWNTLEITVKDISALGDF